MEEVPFVVAAGYVTFNIINVNSGHMEELIHGSP
jgi:hypothetical protein